MICNCFKPCPLCLPIGWALNIHNSTSQHANANVKNANAKNVKANANKKANAKNANVKNSNANAYVNVNANNANTNRYTRLHTLSELQAHLQFLRDFIF